MYLFALGVGSAGGGVYFGVEKPFSRYKIVIVKYDSLRYNWNVGGDREREYYANHLPKILYTHRAFVTSLVQVILGVGFSCTRL